MNDMKLGIPLLLPPWRSPAARAETRAKAEAKPAGLACWK